MGADESQWDRLARAVKQRRNSLGLSQVAVADVSDGPSLASLKNIERGSRGYGRSINSATGLALDRALRWKPGSTLRMISDQADAPEPLDTEGWPTSSGDWAAYVARREREAEDAAEVAEGSRAALEMAEQQAREAEGRRSISEFSDGELIAEMARRLGEARRIVTPPGDAKE